MALINRKKRPLDRTKGVERDARLIVIATEGANTEPQYFRMRIFRGKRVQITLLPTEDGHSSPQAVLKRLTQFKKEFDLGKQDELWFVIDVDDWEPKMLNEVARDCEKKSYRMAVSNPCFELWLYLHRSDIDAGKNHTAMTLEADLRNILGSFNKSNLREADFIDHFADAIGRAKRLDTISNERWPSTLGTHVYRVVESIMKGLG